ncbi:MAG TPA: class C beta-lactamase [Burkholderiaceae bacterium]|nr:class C beta-lactamase [Burkholderiaceae bacterium]
MAARAGSLLASIPTMSTRSFPSLVCAWLIFGAGLVPLASCAAPSSVASSPIPAADAVRAIVDETIRPLMARHDIPGMAVAVTVGGQNHIYTYGLAARAGSIPVTESTLFEVGSVSKAVTATLAAWAVETGRISLADHPSRYLPALKGRPIDRATLLHLGTYTAGGLPQQFPEEIEGDAAAMAWFAAWKPKAAPGAVREYGNPSIALLGLATAQALKRDFAEAVEAEVFPRFGMRHSHVRLPTSALANYAWGHRGDRPIRMRPGPLADETYGVRTTAGDLLRFLCMQIDPSELDAPMRRAVRATQEGHFRAGPMVQGLGWEQYPWPVSREWLLGGNAEEMFWEAIPSQPAESPSEAGQARLYNKTGSTAGFGAYVAFVPAKRIAVVLLANRNYPIPARVEAGWTILDKLAPAPR